MSILIEKKIVTIDQPVVIKKVYWPLLVMLWLGSIPLPGQTAPSREYQVKAVFLFNLAQFVEWPATAFQAKDAPLVIGVLGENPFGTYIEETVQGEVMNGHPLVVQHFTKVEEINTCHILFINLTKPDQLKQIFEKLKTQSTLTVSDANNFTRSGGMIRLFIENSKTRIRINLEATKDAELTISSKLLRLAEIITPQNN